MLLCFMHDDTSVYDLTKIKYDQVNEQVGKIYDVLRKTTLLGSLNLITFTGNIFKGSREKYMHNYTVIIIVQLYFFFLF